MNFSDSKLWATFERLDLPERNRFIRFVSSPYYNSDQKLLALAEALNRAYPLPPARESLDALLFPGETFDYFRISNLLSDLMKLMESFLIAEYTNQHPFLQHYALLVSGREKGLDKLYNAVEKKMEKSIAEIQIFTPQTSYENYLLEDERNIFSVSREQRQENSRLDEKIVALDRFFVSSMLKTVCQRLNQENIIHSHARPAEIDEFVAFIHSHHLRYQSQPFINIYYRILLTLTRPDASRHFYELMDLLSTFGEKIDAEELKPMYQFAQNYCIRQSNRGRTEFLEELLNVFIRMIDMELIYHDGWISPWDFKNIVALGVRLQRFDWTDDFIIRFSPRLEPSFRENALIFNRAQLHYGKEEYSQAMRLLTQVELEDVYYYLGAKTLLLKIYYELEENEALHSLFHAFSESLRRNKTISPYQRTVHLNLIRFVRRLQFIRERLYFESIGVMTKKIHRLAEKIDGEEALTQSEWLKKKLAEFSG
ncbi:MAG: hypothetical protein R3D00_00505 [Bacteroidia bacterium]